MDIEQQIQNFEKMAQDDPENDLGHFSLAKAYLQAGRYEDSAASFERTLQLNRGLSKAYQLLAEAQNKLGNTDQAIATLQQGFEVAQQRGDVMPRDAMGAMLEELGVAPPEVQSSTATADVGAGQVHCCRCGQSGPQIDKVPYKGELADKIIAHVCVTCWQAWIAMGTKVINELGLDFAHPQAGDIYDTHMKEFLQLPE